MSNTSLELAVRTQNAVTDLAHRAQARLSEERGQTAAEYMGLILVVAAFIAILTKADIGNTLKTEITKAIKSV